MIYFNLLQNELNSDVTRFTAHVLSFLGTNKVVRFFFVGGKTNTQHCYSKVTRFAAMLQNKLHVFCCPFSCSFSLLQN